MGWGSAEEKIINAHENIDDSAQTLHPRFLVRSFAFLKHLKKSISIVYANRKDRAIVQEAWVFAYRTLVHVSLPRKSEIRYCVQSCLRRGKICRIGLVRHDWLERSAVRNSEILSRKRHLQCWWDGIDFHYENTPIQIYWKFYHKNNENFQIKILIFFIFLLKK